MTTTFTLFLNHKDGTGLSRDYLNQSSALRAHHRAVKNPHVLRSLLKKYDLDLTTGQNDSAIVADWTAKSIFNIEA